MSSTPTTMKKNPLRAISPILILASLPSHGSLVMHWKLDESNGDYTGGGYLEEVRSNSTIASEASTGSSVAEGQAGIAPDGGTSILFADTDPDSYIAAGSVEDDGTYVSGPASSPFVLGANLTMTAWFNADAVSSDSIILSNQFNSGSGFMFGPRESNFFMDFGNTRASYPAGISVGQDYFVSIRMDLNGDVNFGWAPDANHRISLYNPTTETWQHFDGLQQKTGINLQNLSIGRFTNGGREFDGRIDDVRIYDETLSQADLDAMVVAIPESGSLALLGMSAALGLFRRSPRTREARSSTCK